MILIYIQHRMGYKRSMCDPRDLEFDALPATERLVLVTLRAHIDGCRGHSVETLYRIACGLALLECAVASFESLAAALTAGARRPLRLGRLADARVACDEQCLLALLAAHQLGRRAQLEARTRWLVRTPFLSSLHSAAGAFAGVLARSGHRLSGHWLDSRRQPLRVPEALLGPPALPTGPRDASQPAGTASGRRDSSQPAGAANGRRDGSQSAGAANGPR